MRSSQWDGDSIRAEIADVSAIYFVLDCMWMRNARLHLLSEKAGKQRCFWLSLSSDLPFKPTWKLDERTWPALGGHNLSKLQIEIEFENSGQISTQDMGVVFNHIVRASHIGDDIRVMYSRVTVGVVHVLCACAQLHSAMFFSYRSL